MASYIPITDAEDDPEAPATSYLAKRWKNNPIAIAERASGAPRVKPSSIEVLTGSGNWTVPDGVTRVRVRLVGGGGGGATSGGGGGAYAEGVLDVTPAALVAYAVGAAGSAGAAGGNSTFNGAASMQAAGGAGASGGTPGAGGAASGTDVTVGISGSPGSAISGSENGGGSALSPPMTAPSAGIFPGGGGGFIVTGQAGAAGTIILEY